MINTQTSRNAEGYFNANDFRDLTIDNSKPLMTDAIIHQPNTANINPNKHWSKQKKFVDYFLYRGWESHLVYDKANELIK